MAYQCWFRRLLLLFFVGGVLGLVGPASLWAQTASGLPELHPISLIFTPSSPVDPATTSVVVATAQVVNTGSASAGPFKVQFSFCLQNQVTVCAENDFTNFGVSNTLPGLGVGGQASVSGVLDIASLRLGLGLLRIRVVVDPDNQAAELDENNNEMTALLTLGTNPVSTTISAIAVGNKAVYVGTINGTVSAFALDDCTTQGCPKQIWQFTAGGAIHAIVVDSNRGDFSSIKPSTNPTNTVYVASDDGTVYALTADAQSRTSQPRTLWRFPANPLSPMLSLALSSKTVGPNDVDPLLIYAGTQDGTVFAIRTDGTQRWAFTNTSPGSASFAINALAVDTVNQLYVGTANGVVYAIKPDAALSASQMQPAWSSFNKNNQQFGVINALAMDTIPSPTLVYAGSEDKSVYSLFGNDGSLNWTFRTDKDISSTELGGAVKALGVDPTTGGLYVGTSTNVVYGLSFKNNKTLPDTRIACLRAQGSITAITVDPKPPPEQGTTAFGAIALVASQDRNLYVLETKVVNAEFKDCPQRGTLSIRQSPNSSPITSTGPLQAAAAIVSVADPAQLRKIFFGADRIVKFDVLYGLP